VKVCKIYEPLPLNTTVCSLRSHLCDCGEIQTMSHIVNLCPLTKFDGGLLRLHEADEVAVGWLTTYGS